MAGTAFLFALLLFALSLAALLVRTESLPSRDWALAVPYAAKAAIPVWIAAAAPPGMIFSEPRGLGVPLGILLLGFTLPGLVVLASLALAEGGTVRRFRLRARRAESMGALAWGAWGIYQMVDLANYDRHGSTLLIGGAMLLLALPLLGLAQIAAIPFQAEGSADPMGSLSATVRSAGP